jgi:Tol biopolymer transport system component
LLANRQNAKRPRLSPDRKWVAFDGTPPGKPVMSDFDIQLVAFDGTGLRTLTSTSDWDLDAQWSPDGQWIAFTRNPPSPTDCAESTVWVMRRDGSQAHSVGPGCVVRWSPDGRQLAFADQATLAIKLVNVDGSDVRTLARSTFTQQPDGFSPDGTSILLTRAADVSGRSTQIMLLSLGTGSLRSLALGDAACWSPDGSAILYTNGLESPLSIMGPEGSHQRVLISVAASEPDWR